MKRYTGSGDQVFAIAFHLDLQRACCCMMFDLEDIKMGTSRPH